MTGQEIQAFLTAAQALLEVAAKLGASLEAIVASLTPGALEAEFGPCLKCGKEGPITTYRTMDGALVRRVWCGTDGCAKR